MKITNVVLLACAVVVGLLAQRVFADPLADGCPGSITWNAQHVSQLACPTDCSHNGKSGKCEERAIANTVPVYNYDATQGKWVATIVGGIQQQHTGSHRECNCKVNEGTAEEPNWQFYANPCCIIYRIPSFDGNQVHYVGLTGACGGDCPSGSCQVSGNNNVATAVCE